MKLRYKRAQRHGGGQQRVDLEHVNLASATGQTRTFKTLLLIVARLQVGLFCAGKP